MLTTAQIRAARSLLDWSQAQLAEVAKLSLPTIKRMEGKGPQSSTAANVEAVRRALLEAGVQFIDEGPYQGDGGPGVRLRQGSAQPASAGNGADA